MFKLHLLLIMLERVKLQPILISMSETKQNSVAAGLIKVSLQFKQDIVVNHL